jgi:hypothetical protein
LVRRADVGVCVTYRVEAGTGHGAPKAPRQSLLDGAVIKCCVPSVVLVVHDSAFREPLPFRPIEFAMVCSRRRWGDRAAARQTEMSASRLE